MNSEPRSAISWALAIAMLALWGLLAWSGFKPVGGFLAKGMIGRFVRLGRESYFCLGWPD